MTEYKNFPIAECVNTVRPLIESGRATIYQKYSCFRCKSRQTMEVPNTFFDLGTCSECGYVTDITRWGCNYVAIFKGGTRAGK